uniref:Uncharacterized protein n=1 Tax=Trichobilharzia regenti TaxID=157069 RepID=A0AA85ITH3_TRIRE|nr:unnamed protein product [Trichobilharzia regenti]
MSKHPSVSIWNTTDDNNTNSTFDLDEDDLFADRFASSKNNFTSPTPKGNWSDKWTKLMKFDGSSKKNEPGQLSYTSPKLPNLRSVPVNSQRSKFITSPIDLEQPRSPSPTEHTRLQKHAPASPMLDFLNDRSKKTIMQSPDVYNVSTSSEDDVLLNRTVRKSPDYTSAETSCIDNDCEKADNNYNTGDKSPGSVSLSDNFECLYNRLKKEASDLESWKCNTLSQLEGKCLELESYESLVENLRSANVELQINLENMSLKYKEEVELRDNVLERFSSIQSQSSALEERVKKLAEASMTVKSRVFQSEELYDVLRRNYENIKKEFLEHSETCLAKYKEFEDIIESKKCDVEALQQRIIQLGDENKCLEEELILCDRKHQEEIIQLQREIDGLNTDKIELKQMEENIKCSNEEYKSLIKSLESTIENERAMRINAVKLSETKEKEHEDLVCLLDEHQHKCRLRIQFLDASKQKLNYLCDQVDKSRFHVKSMIDKISNMIKSLSTFQEKQHHRNEDIFHTLTVVKGKVVELKKVLNNRSLIMHDFESNIYNICADLVMENHLLCIDRENSVILRRKVTELEKDTECMYKRQDNMRAALEKCQIFNEKLQLDNDELHSKLTSEKQKYAEVHGNLLKSEALVKLLEEQTKMIEEEVKEMRTKFSEVKKELEEKRANCSKLKEKMEACEIRYNELKLTDEENRKALNLAHSEIKGREEQQEN